MKCGLCLCRKKAEKISDAINKTKEAMNTTEEAIEKSRTAIEKALENLNSTQNVTAMVWCVFVCVHAYVYTYISYILSSSILFVQVEDKLSNLEASLMDMMMRLNNLSQGVDFLTNKTEQNRQQATEAKALSDNATQAASELKEVCLLSIVTTFHFLHLYFWTEISCMSFARMFVSGFVTC